MDDRMERRAPWMPWAMTSVILLLVAIAAYSFGAHQEAMSAGADTGARAWRYGPFPGIFTLFLMFWIFGGLRWMLWGGCGRPWRYRRYYHPRWRDDRDDRDEWEQWHRREHERMNMPTGNGPASRSDAGRGAV
ncbi:MAG: hypothetical protein ABI634_17555 [Acidobacteriota bacterium]